MDGGDILIERPHRTDDGATIVIRPDNAQPVPIAVRLPDGLEIDQSADPAVAAALLPAMRRGENLRSAESVSTQLRESTVRFQRILGSWDRHLHGNAPRFSTVAIEAPQRRLTKDCQDGRGTACFFTAGADSLHSAITNLDRLDALIHVRGFDALSEESPLGKMIHARVQEAARLLSLPLLTISTDLKNFSDACDVSWDEYHGSALATMALLLAPHFSRVLIPATNTYADLVPLGSHPLLDPLWSTECVEIVHDGADAGRIDKIRTAASHPAGRAHLQVCWEHVNQRYNCGVCEKCVRTGVAVRLAGLEGVFPDLPTPTIRQVAGTQPRGRGVAWKELDAVARTSGQRALTWAIRAARARHRLGRIRLSMGRR